MNRLWLVFGVLALVAFVLWSIDGLDRSRTRRVSAERGPANETVSAPSTGATPGSSEPRLATTERFTGRVRVTGPNDEPIEGVTIRDLARAIRFDGPTDANGWTQWAADEEPIGNQFVDSLTGAWHAIQRPDTHIRLPRMIPVEVEFVDVNTGLVLEGGAARLAHEAARHKTGRHAKELLVTPVQAGSHARLVVDLDPPRGFAARVGLREVAEAHVSARATRARLRVPVWPQWNVTLDVRDEQNRAVSGAELVRVAVAGVWIRFDAKPSDAGGRLVVRGLPRMPGATALFCIQGLEEYNRVRIEDPDFVHRVTLRDDGYAWAPHDHGTPVVEEIPDEEAEVVEEEPLREPKSRLRVRARWPGGSSAPGIEIRCTQSPHRTRPSQLFGWSGVAPFRVLESGDGIWKEHWPSKFHVVAFDAAAGFPHAPVTLSPGEFRTVDLGPSHARVVTIRTQHPGTRVLPRGLFESIRPFRNGVQDLSAIAGPEGVLVWEKFPTLPVGLSLTRGRLAGGAEIRAGTADVSITSRPGARKRRPQGRERLR